MIPCCCCKSFYHYPKNSAFAQIFESWGGNSPLCPQASMVMTDKSTPIIFSYFIFLKQAKTNFLFIVFSKTNFISVCLKFDICIRNIKKILDKKTVNRNIGLRNMFVAFLYFLLFYNDFLLLGKEHMFIR